MTKNKIGIVIDALHTGGVEKIAINQTLALSKLAIPGCLVVLRRTKFTNYPYQPLLDKIEVVFLDDRLPKLLKLSFRLPFS